MSPSFSPLALLLAMLAGAVCTSAGSIDRKLNVLMMAVDDLRPEIHSYGIDGVRTPAFDYLAKTSLQFNNAYCQQAICNPTRSSLLTSRRPNTTRVIDLGTYFRKAGGNFTTIPEFFKLNGYQSIGMGKIFHPGHNDDAPYSWSVPYFHAPAQRKYGCCGNRTSSWWAVDDAIELPDQQIAANAVQWLQKLKDQDEPFFLAVGFHKPHLPFFCPKKFYDLYQPGSVPLAPNRYRPKGMPEVAWNPLEGLRFWNDFNRLNVSFPDGICPDNKSLELRRAYYACVSYIDAQMGDVLHSLEDFGMSNNTIVILWGDHGWQLGEHGEWGKYTNFEYATRVPLYIRIPGMSTGGETTSALVEYVDLLPTLAEAAGLEVPSMCNEDSRETKLCTEGVSLLPLINNPTRQWKKAAFSQYPRPSVRETLRQPRYCGAHFDPSYCDTMGYTMRTARYRYTEWVPFNNFTSDWNHPRAVELYDHQTDPTEDNNLVNTADPGLVKSLSEQLHSGWRGALPRQ